MGSSELTRCPACGHRNAASPARMTWATRAGLAVLLAKLAEELWQAIRAIFT